MSRLNTTWGYYLNETKNIDSLVDNLYSKYGIDGVVDLYVKFFLIEPYERFPNYAGDNNGVNKMHRVRFKKELDYILERIERYFGKYIREELGTITVEESQGIWRRAKVDFEDWEYYNDLKVDLKALIHRYIMKFK